jgi:uncharacterized protein (DUF1800 family)
MLLLAAVVLSAGVVRAQDAEVAAKPDVTQERAAHAFAEKTFADKAKVVAPKRTVVLVPLTKRERVVQLLDRFTFGPRPGEVDRVLAEGEGKWLDAQMDPDAIPDDRLQKRLADYPTLAMTAQEAEAVYPVRNQVFAVYEGKVPYPADPLMHGEYEVLTYKADAEKALHTAQGVPGYTEPSEGEKAAQKKAEQAIAERIFGELIVLPKGARMHALMRYPVEERAAFAADGNLTRDQRYQLLGDFSPRERETFLAISGTTDTSNRIMDELSQARMLRDVLSERQLQAVMTNFWFNHFNIYAPKDTDRWYTTSYERDVIAKNALGNFQDLLLATAQSPAMMVYLDNWLSIGPDSIANGVDPRNPNAARGTKGLNENYGREVMELHTVGVNGGYSQADVTALSAILTGWGVENQQQGGGFVFDYKRHEPGPKLWFGYVIDEDGKATKLGPGVKRPAATFGPSNVVATPESAKQGIAALTILAQSPQTAHFISYLLAQYFLADKPPSVLVDRLQRAYLASHGDIKTVLRALIASPEFNSRQYFRNKVKTPEEFVASAFRATATDPQNPGAMVGTINTMGMPVYRALAPTGYYLTADQWMSSSALVNRLNFAYQLTNNKFANQKFDAPKLLAMGLLEPSGAGELSGFGKVKPAVGTSTPGKPKWMGVVATDAPEVKPTAGAQVAMHVLEATMIGDKVSAQTNELIEKQMEQEPEGASPTDTLNLLTALVMGSPEFQLR